MKNVLILTTTALMTLNTVAAEAPNSPLHVLYLGPANVGSGGRGGGGFGGGGGSRTNYIYLPGQTLATDAIYFDHRADVTNLTDSYLKHFDAVVQVMPDAEVGGNSRTFLRFSPR